jgi:hypothetical protein
MSARIRRRVRTTPRICERCGSKLERELPRKFETFWLVLIIALGAALAFYLIGLLIIAIGLWLWARHRVLWKCPTCGRETTPEALLL